MVEKKAISANRDHIKIELSLVIKLSNLVRLYLKQATIKKPYPISKKNPLQCEKEFTL